MGVMVVIYRVLDREMLNLGKEVSKGVGIKKKKKTQSAIIETCEH